MKDTRTREMIYPVRIVATYGNVENAESLLKEKYLQITTSEPDCIIMGNGEEGEEAAVVLDFGKELHGSLRVLTHKSIGTTSENVRITLGESVAEALSEIGEKNATNDHATRDFTAYLPSYSDMTFQEGGFRFACIRVKGKNVTLRLKAAVAVAIYREMEYLGSFQCNNETLNQIFDTAAYTCHICVQNYIIEGVKRDRLVWVGDMHPQVLTLRTVFGNIPDVEETIRFTRNSTPLPKWMNSHPTYSVWWLIILHDWYQYSGNRAFLDENKEYVIGLTKQIISYIHEDGSDEYPHYFLDWPCHDRPEEADGSRALIALGLKTSEALANLYEEKELAELCNKRYQAMIGRDANSYGAKQVAAMLALSGWWDTQKAGADILENGAKGWSTFMSYYLLKVAAQKDMAKTLHGLEEYYGAMLNLGATTFWEDFNLDWTENAARIDEVVLEGKKDIHGDYGAFCYKGFRHSFCHGWSSAPTAFLLEDVIGIKILEPGCKKLAIRPNLGDLEWAEGTYPTPYGVVTVSHKKDANGSIETVVTAPQEIEIEG